MLKKVGYNFSRLQIIREGFLVYLNANEDLSRLSANEIISIISSNDFNGVVPQKILSEKKNCDHMLC